MLEARDLRWKLLERYLGASYSATLFLSLNIPGDRKDLPGGTELFSWGIRRVTQLLRAVNLRTGRDPLGPFAVMLLDVEGVEAKRRCIGIEESRPAARLLDLDVYDRDGVQIDRASLGLPPRRCLLCHEGAAECMRVKRHQSAEVVERAGELLALL